jgi:hypothetical protein
VLLPGPAGVYCIPFKIPSGLKINTHVAALAVRNGLMAYGRSKRFSAYFHSRPGSTCIGSIDMALGHS